MSDDQVDHFTVLLEEIKSQVGLIGEGHRSLNVKMDAIARDTAKMSGHLEMVDLRLASLEQKTGKIDGRVKRLEEAVHTIKDHLGLNGVAKPKRAPAKRRPKK